RADPAFAHAIFADIRAFLAVEADADPACQEFLVVEGAARIVAQAVGKRRHLVLLDRKLSGGPPISPDGPGFKPPFVRSRLIAPVKDILHMHRPSPWQNGHHVETDRKPGIVSLARQP